MTTIERLAYRPDECALTLGVSRDTIFKLLRSGELKSLKIQSARLIPASEVDAFLARKLAEASA